MADGLESSRKQGQSLAPLIALRDVVIIPGREQLLFVGRKLSLVALEHAVRLDGNVVFVTQRDESVDEPGQEELYEIGCLAHVRHVQDSEEGARKARVMGLRRVRLESVVMQQGLTSPMQGCMYTKLDEQDASKGKEAEQLRENLAMTFNQAKKGSKGFVLDVEREALLCTGGLGELVDRLAGLLNLPVPVQQAVLEELVVLRRGELLLAHKSKENDISRFEKQLQQQARDINAGHRVDYLKERAAKIQSALDESGLEDIDDLHKQAEESGMPDGVKSKVTQEISRLASMTQMSPEATVIRTYLEALLCLPWKERTEVNYDLGHARAVLDADHNGLDRVKERIIEYLAVQQQVSHNRGSVMCFLGPPGVGKTSLGRSIARATGRRFVRVALGGVHDEAFIRGHRRTYVASMLGRILKSMAEVKVRNPVFMLDEIDKLDKSFNGDPMAALLEVIDPEQNGQFVDQYAEVEFDLSEVMFIATANSSETMYPALRDRLEIIELPGYTNLEKVAIARQHLVPKQLEANGLAPGSLRFSEAVLDIMIRDYTKEAGVRNLERNIAKVCRKTVLEQDMAAAANPDAVVRKSLALSKAAVCKKLGTPLVFNALKRRDSVGIVNGLAVVKDWEGVVHQIDAVTFPGTEGLVKTGNLMPNIEQSIEAACTVLRTNPGKYGMAEDFLDKHQAHIHYPNIDVPHDGNSNGLALFALLVSVFNSIPVRVDTAITGAVNLRGEACAVGALREKVVGAWRERIYRVVIPHVQARELAELPRDIAKEMEIITVSNVDEVLRNLLVRLPEARKPGAGKDKELLVAKKAVASRSQARH